jgi:hypothetical protein
MHHGKLLNPDTKNKTTNKNMPLVTGLLYRCIVLNKWFFYVQNSQNATVSSDQFNYNTKDWTQKSEHKNIVKNLGYTYKQFTLNPYTCTIVHCRNICIRQLYIFFSKNNLPFVVYNTTLYYFFLNYLPFVVYIFFLIISPF